MSNTVKTQHIHEDGNYFIIQPVDDEYIPAACPNCQLMLADHTDVMTYRQYKCCAWCKFTFASGDIAEQRWVSGWRPSLEHINMLLQSKGLI